MTTTPTTTQDWRDQLEKQFAGFFCEPCEKDEPHEVITGGNEIHMTPKPKGKKCCDGKIRKNCTDPACVAYNPPKQQY